LEKPAGRRAVPRVAPAASGWGVVNLLQNRPQRRTMTVPVRDRWSRALKSPAEYRVSTRKLGRYGLGLDAHKVAVDAIRGAQLIDDFFDIDSLSKVQ